MYNRYIPQADGSYRRNRVEDPRPKIQETPRHKPEAQNIESAPPPPPPPKQPPKQPPRHKEMPQHPNHRDTHGTTDGLGGFLRQLLPRDFDTGDLIVILLLLLLAGDCEEDRANAILTLALYMVL